MENSDQPVDFYKNLESPLKQSEEELWDRIAARTVDRQEPKSAKLVRMANVWRVAAACLLLAAGLGVFLRFYTESVVSPNGKHISQLLPDGSRVEMNAATVLSYKPYWWAFSREVELKGEAYFEVAKGKRFQVKSVQGITQVLGTSFNIFARGHAYRVFCKTGKVKVLSTQSSVELTLDPGQLAVVDNQNKKGKIKSASASETMGWKTNKFTFTSEPLRQVLQEVERQYNVKIHLALDKSSHKLYSGYFNRSDAVEDVLKVICLSFELQYKEVRTDEYIIYSSM